MKSVILRLLTLQGDELGRLPLLDVHLPEAGASGNTPVRPHLTEQMETLYARIVSVVEAEQMEVTLSPIEMQVTVSRVLLASDDAADVVIDLPVREALPTSNSTKIPELSGGTLPADGWNDLWEMEEIQ